MKNWLQIVLTILIGSAFGMLLGFTIFAHADCDVWVNGHQVVDVPLGHTAHIHTIEYLDAQKVYLEKKKSDALEHIKCDDYKDYILEEPDLDEAFYKHWDLTHRSVERAVKQGIKVDKE